MPTLMALVAVSAWLAASLVFASLAGRILGLSRGCEAAEPEAMASGQATRRNGTERRGKSRYLGVDSGIPPQPPIVLRRK